MKKVIVIVGPTGVGKTKLGVKLAQQINGEIISGDSIQVYKPLNIGSAKVTKEEREDIPHYLIDVCDLNEEYHVKEFQTKARQYIDQISENHKHPIIVGGTGFYIKACLYDYVFTDEQEDTAYLQLLESKTSEELYQMLIEIDSNATETIHKNNRKRVIRALMIAQSSTFTKTEMIAQQNHSPIYDVYLIGLTMDREKLYQRINHRVEVMMENGLEEEVFSLYQKDKNVFSLQAMQGIGYKEWKEYFLGNDTKEKVIHDIQTHSRQFAKRQYTWFNNQMDVHWYDIDSSTYENQILSDIREWLND